MLQYTLFITLAPIALIIALAVVVLCWRYRSGPGVGTLMAAMLSVGGWLILNTLELVARSPESTVCWAKLSYLFIVSSSTLWVCFAIRYSGRGHWLMMPRGLILWVIPSITVVLMSTNHLHGLMWREFEFLPVNVGLAMRVVQYGPWFWVNAAQAYLLVVFGAGLLGLQSISQFKLYRQQAVWLMLGAVSPLILNLVYLLRVVPGFTKDFSSIGLSLAGFFVSVGVFRHRLFDLTPVARAAIIENMQDAVLVLDLNGRVVDMNPAVTQFTGVDSREAIGNSVVDTFTEWRQLFSRYDGVTDLDTTVTLGAGTASRHYGLRVSPLSDRFGRITGRLLLIRDVTTEKQAEMGYVQANAELQQQIEMREELIGDLNAFADTVAHDLKNPLNLIAGYSEVLLQDVDEGRYGTALEWVPMVRPIARTAQKMSRIIEEMLLLSSTGYEPVEPVPLDMESIVADVKLRLERQIVESGAVITMPDSWPAALGYAPWVEEVWANYVDNAIKYGGRPPRMELGALEQEDGAVRFWVRDNGDGVRSGLREKIFDMYTRGETAEIPGHGLGLAIVKRIVEKLGGQVMVESAGPGGGSAFSFTLPRVPPSTGL